MKLIAMLSILIFTQNLFSFDHSHALWSKVLKEYQTNKGLIQYKKLKKDSSTRAEHEFNRYLKDLSAVTFKEYEAYNKEQKMSFLINAYNAFTFKLIVDNYPVKSIKDLGSFFKKPWSIEFFSILDGKIKSLDPIEHEWLRPHFKDYRIHAAVNCASISCPPLRNEAFVPERLSKQLDHQMKQWIADPTRNKVNSKNKEWKVSKIFDWYEDDFENWGNGVETVINKYSSSPISKKALEEIDIDYMKYNWGLNEAK